MKGISTKTKGRFRIWTIGLLTGVAAAGLFYVLSAPPIVKACVRRTGHWPAFYGPMLQVMENDSPAIHGVFRWYFNNVWGCGITFFSDPPPNAMEEH
jgi:hypothetical protein